MKILQRPLSRATVVALALAAGVLAGRGGPDYKSAVLADGPLGYWRFSETDVAPQPNIATNLGSDGVKSDGTYIEGPLYWDDFSTMKQQPGVLSSDNAAHFDGSSQYVSVPLGAVASIETPFTVECWAKLDTYPLNGRTYWCLMTTGSWAIFAEGIGFNWRLKFSAYGTTAPVTNGPGGETANTNVWYHLMGTFDGTLQRWYLNGVLAGTDDGTISLVYENGVGVPGTTNAAGTDIDYTPDTANPLGIGADVKAVSAHYNFQGSLAEVAIYPSVLPASAAAAHYAAGTNNVASADYAAMILSNNPVGYWRLNDLIVPLPVATNSGTLGAAADGGYIFPSTTGLDLDSPTFPGLETSNTVLELPNSSSGNQASTNSRVEIPPLNLDTNTVTIEGWVKLNGLQGAGAGLVFSHDLNVLGTSNQLNGALTWPVYYAGDGLEIGSDGQELAYTWNETSTNPTAQWDSGLEIPTNQWAYVALTISPNQAMLFLGTNNTADGWFVASNLVPNLSEGFTTNAYIGRNDTNAAPGTNLFFNGAMDEVAIYNQTLTEGQLHTHMLGALGSANPPSMVASAPAPILIPSEPIYETTPFTLVADAYGQPPLFFQWRSNGVPILGATALSYGLISSAIDDTANYDVIVSNANGSVTSLVTLVTVTPPPLATITHEPQSTTNYVGGAATFRVGASAGDFPLSYQWTHDGTNLLGATNGTLIVSPVNAADIGSYAVIVTDVTGSVTSAPPAILTDILVAAGSYTANIVADSPLGYWRLNESGGTTAFDYFGGNNGVYEGGVSLDSQAGPLLGDTNMAPQFDGVSGLVRIPASGTLLGSGLTNVSQATFVGWINSSGQRMNEGNGLLTGVLDGGGAPFGAIAANGLYINKDGTLNYSWNGAEAKGNQGTYGFDSGFVVDPLSIGAWVFAAVVVQPTLATVYMGTSDGGLVNITNPVSAGTADFTAGPFAIGEDITVSTDYFGGDIADVAIFTNALTGNQIQTLFLSGKYGTNTAPFIIQQPASTTVQVGSDVTLSVVPGGSPPLYQWLFGETPIPGATNFSLSLPNVYYTSAGSYTVIITNALLGHSVTSAPAALTVLPPPTFANVTNGLLLHLTFDGNFNDSSGLGNNPTVYGNPTFVPGRLGQAVYLSSFGSAATNNYLQIPETDTYFLFGDTNSFSVSFWASFTDDFNDLPIVGNAVNSTYNLGWVITDDGDNQLEWTLVGLDYGSVIADPVGGPLINDGAWHQIVVVFNRSTELASSFVDGVKVNIRSIGEVGSLIDTGELLTIGNDPTGAYGVSGWFNLDDLGIWGRALNDYEALSIYAAGQANESFDVVGPVQLSVNHVGTNIDLSWQTGTLQESTNLSGPFTPVPGATSPFYQTNASGSSMFFRVKL